MFIGIIGLHKLDFDFIFTKYEVNQGGASCSDGSVVVVNKSDIVFSLSKIPFSQRILPDKINVVNKGRPIGPFCKIEN